ncbi:MAG: hypothetical protein DRJ50_06075 [Actinobacteria bacterium]|nr:MAG: hypothetical protein DRJ50_06075 [Actinomycetota bacterium]
MKTVVFIVGPARSGTSLLYRLLCLHPQVSFVSNWNARFPRAPVVAGLQRATRASPSLRRRWFQADGNAYVYGRKRPLTERLIPAPVEGEPVFAAAGITEEGTALREDSGRALGKGIASIARYAGGTHFINKRVANNRRIGLLHDALPDARFVSIVRDGRAVALSLSKVDWWQESPVWWADGVTPVEWEARGGDPWQLCAKNWVREVDAIEQGLEPVPDSAQHAITYEELVADPITVLTGIAAAIELPVDEEWLNEVSALSLPNQNERWQTELGDHATRVIMDEQEPTLRRLGYLRPETP